MVSTDCVERRCSAGHALAGVAIANYDVITSPALGGGMYCPSDCSRNISSSLSFAKMEVQKITASRRFLAVSTANVMDHIIRGYLY